MLVVLENLVTFPFMNILIEDAEKMEYLTSNNQWTKNVADGKNFGGTETAYDAAKKELIGKFNIVSYISQTRQFINLDHGRGKGIPETSPVLESAPVPQS
jgi:hypothetical protein